MTTRESRSLPPTTVVELRRYTLHPGQRDVLIELFDREFVESQEAVGMRVLGQFTETGEPDRFVWLRGFTDMDARHHGLAAFYGGPVWAEHRDAANATMIDSSDVLLLRPVDGPSASLQPTAPRPGPGATPRESVVVKTILSFENPVDDDLRTRLTEQAARAGRLGLHTVGCFETEPAENTFPALPVRAGEHVLVWLTRHESEHAAAEAAVRLAAAADSVAGGHSRSATQWLNLHPTGRSLMR